jgi:hypothetical protein
VLVSNATYYYYTVPRALKANSLLSCPNVWFNKFELIINLKQKNMFRKLVSNLPFNPSLLGTVAFYAKRMRQEESLRRLGFAFVALAMFIQVFAVVAPPEKSLAYSNDYIINGLRTRDDILRAWDGQTSDQNVAAIYSRFGLTREDIAALPLYPNATLRSDSADYWTIGRTSLSAVSKAGQIQQVYKDSEVPVIAGDSTVYLRQLRAWDIVNPYNSYKAFQGTKNGQPFWILVDCGNFTKVGMLNLTEPALELRKTIDGGPRTLKPGDNFAFRFEYRNSVPDSQPVQNAVLNDEFDLDKFEIIRTSPAIQLVGNGRQIALPLGSVSYTPHFNTALIVSVRLKTNLPNGTKACNAAKLSADNAADAWSGGSTLCITVITPCPLDSGITSTDPACINPVLACNLSNSAVNRTTKEFTLKTSLSSSNPAYTKVLGYVYDFGDGSSVITKPSNAYEDAITHTYKDGKYTATVVVNYRVGSTAGAQTDGSVACSASIESEPDKPLTSSKSVRNVTQNLDATQTPSSTAKAGDTVEYTLITRNSYDYDRTNINVADYIGDILDYATLDKAYLTQQGGTYNQESKTLAWSDQSIKANSELSNKFRVQLKNPLPSTNQPSPMTTAFDCIISNKFGNQLDIKVDCPLPKSAEYITQTLPKTGPGTSLLIGFVATSIIAYFFMRSRLLAEELELIRTDFAQTGGI